MKVHFCRPGSVRTCSQQSYGFTRTSDPAKVTCDRCLKNIERAGARAKCRTDYHAAHAKYVANHPAATATKD